MCLLQQIDVCLSGGLAGFVCDVCFYVCVFERVGERVETQKAQEVMLSLYEETFSVHYPACRYN